MFHSQQSVFQLMENDIDTTTTTNNNNNTTQLPQQQQQRQKPHYTRIGMFRNDVFICKHQLICIYQIPKVKYYFSITNNYDKRSNQFNLRREQQEQYEYDDVKNQYAIITQILVNIPSMIG
jgi:hypothetical protein